MAGVLVSLRGSAVVVVASWHRCGVKIVCQRWSSRAHSALRCVRDAYGIRGEEVGRLGRQGSR